MCTRCSLLCALLLPPHPHPPVPRRAVVPLQYDDIKIITFSLIQRPDSTTLISMFVPCIFCRLPNTDNRIRAFSQMQKTRKKCFSSDYTNTKCLDDVFSHHLSHTITTHRHDVERELSACNSVNRRLFFFSFPSKPGGFTIPSAWCLQHTADEATQHEMHCYCCFSSATHSKRSSVHSSLLYFSHGD